jgi:hypothetical protein
MVDKEAHAQFGSIFIGRRKGVHVVLSGNFRYRHWLFTLGDCWVKLLSMKANESRELRYSALFFKAGFKISLRVHGPYAFGAHDRFYNSWI